MGIPGLTTYIEKRKTNFFEHFALHNTRVIIDGRNVCAKLYRDTDCNDLYGGDYNRFVHYIFQFFNDLLQCKVTPLVILDGGWPNKKKETMINRAEEKIREYANRISGKKKSEKIFPIFAGVVFREVMKKMGIQYCMCIFEADDTISSISKILNVPVISYDSDFFIYGVEYIPLNTLDRNIVKYAKGYVIECRIFRVNSLLEQFPGLNITVLPLASVLLGNDYITRDTFANFFSFEEFIHMKHENDQQCRIETVFQWLKNHSLNSAVVTILSRLPKEDRKRFLQLIENIVDGYSRLTTYMVRPLGIEEETNVNIHENFKPFKFDAHSDNSAGIDDAMNNMKLYDNEDDEGSNEHEEWTEEKFLASVPQWFIDDFLIGSLPFYFIIIMIHRMYIAPVQVEDFSKHPAMKISTQIITKIFSLLTTSRDNKANNTNTVIQLFVRESMALKVYNLSVPLSSVAFEDIRSLSVIERKKIIDDTLKNHAGDNLEELPPSWQLYVAVILFWMRQDDEAERTKLHLNALLMTMLIGIINKNIGFRKIQSKTRRHFLNNITNMHEEKIYGKVIGDDKSMTITNLINSVTKEDCISAAPFFNDFHHTQPHSTHTKFRVEIIHACSQFQACLSYAMDLNSLLSEVYVQPSPAEFIDGATFYNFYVDFSTKSDIHEYIATKLKHSGSLMKVFMVLSTKIFKCLQCI